MQGDADFMAPDALIEEEKRLHAEREKQRLAEAPSPSSINADVDTTSPPVTAPFAPVNNTGAPKAISARPPPSLVAGRYNALENLLNKSEMYTKFLVEQIANDVEGEALLSSSKAPPLIPTPSAAPAPKAGKGAKGKRGRADASTSSLSTLEAGEASKGAESHEEHPNPFEAFEATQRILPLLNADLRDYQIKGVK